MSQIGVVVIGRNEGERLRRCLSSVTGGGAVVVYVDSGSTDGSVPRACAAGCQVLELDLTRPFTAARARNEGFALLLQVAPETQYVQFVDGDCEVQPDWLERAAGELDRQPDLAVVCGRRREREPNASVYNLLCDLEWDTPPGEAKACGGDALMRVRAFREVGGFDGALIAGEEPELCVRLRARGWKVVRLDAEMTLHDAAMLRFAQWWRRTVRGGFAFALGAWLHGRGPQRHWVRDSLSIWAWAGLLPGLIVAAVMVAGPWGLLPALVYPVMVARIAWRYRRPHRTAVDRLLYGGFCMLAKFPQLEGQLRFWLRPGRTGTAIIEYKGP